MIVADTKYCLSHSAMCFLADSIFDMKRLTYKREFLLNM